jgi:predicted Zn finger-like uncharacterized protein
MTISFHCEECGQSYRVPDDKAGKKAKCKKCGAAILAPAPPDVEQLPSGGEILRHKSRERDFEVATGDEEAIEGISEHIEQHIGEIDIVYHEMVSDLIHVDVHRVLPTEERPFYTLITSGMSDRPMTVPAGAEAFEYAELMIYLLSDWPMEESDFENETNYWPIRLMKMLSRLPHEYETWLALDHTVPNGDPPDPYSGETGFVCAMLAVPEMENEEFWRLEINDEKTINFFSIVPLYAEETNFKLKRGADALFERFERDQISQVIDIGRKNVCRKRFGIF